MNKKSKAYLLGGGIGSLAAAAFMIRDGKLPGENISILEAAPIMGGSLDGAGNPASGYSMRGGRMLTTDNYECTWDLYKSIPSLSSKDKTVFDETVEFNEKHKANSMARLVDRRRAKVPVSSMGFSMQDRMELLKLSNADEDMLGASRIIDWLSPAFFETEFWYMWSTTFAFQPWHSAVEFKRYLHRFMLEFSRIETLAGVKRTVYNQYDSLVRPLQSWLEAQGVRFVMNCTVTDLDHKSAGGMFIVTGIHCRRQDKSEVIEVMDRDLVFFQNGSMTDASSLGSMTSAPEKLTKADSGGWALWEKLAAGRPEFGNPAAFDSSIAQSSWQSFTVTLKNPAFFNQMIQFSGNEPGTGGLVTFKDSNWLMSIVLAHQPHFPNQPEDVQVFWGYSFSRTESAISLPSRWSIAMVKKFCANSAVIFDSIWIRSNRHTAFHAVCRTSPACSCLACAVTGPCRCPEDRRTLLLSASSSRFRMLSCLLSNIRYELPRWPSMSCLASTARSHPSRLTTNRFGFRSRR